MYDFMVNCLLFSVAMFGVLAGVLMIAGMIFLVVCMYRDLKK